MASVKDGRDGLVSVSQRQAISSNQEQEVSQQMRSVSPPSFALTASGVASGQAPLQRREYYKSSEENSWIEDRRNDKNLHFYTSKHQAEERKLYLMAVGDWEEYKVVKRVVDGKEGYYVMTKGRRTISNFIRLVEKLEGAYPDASTEQILDMLRAIGGYNNELWRALLDKDTLIPGVRARGKLTEDDLQCLKLMMQHGGNDTAASEHGVVRDNLGQMLAMGHVVTGMAAGKSRNHNVDLRSTQGLKGTAAQVAGIGSTVDNLYAATISGDLGQSASMIDRKGGGKDTAYIGDRTEATNAEIIGDVDGFNLGSMMEQFGEAKVSAILRQYYAQSGLDSRRRWHTFRREAGDLKDQTARFANNFRFQTHGLKDGLMAEVQDNVQYALDQFEMDRLLGEGGGIGELSSALAVPKQMAVQEAAFLHSDDKGLIQSKMGTLTSGTKVGTMPNKKESRQGLVYVMIRSGQYEGRTGWVRKAALK